MTVASPVERAKSFFLRKRKKRWLLAGLALLLLGQWLDAKELSLGGIASTGVALTESMHERLEELDPGYVLDRYYERGIGHLTSDGRAPGVFSSAWATVWATPAVARDIWRKGGWFERLLFALTFAGVVGGIAAAWRSKDATLPTAFFTTVALILMGPLLGSLLCWIVLQLLLLLTFLIGRVFAGLAVVAAVLGGAWQFGKTVIEFLKKADEAEESVQSVREIVAPKPPE